MDKRRKYNIDSCRELAETRGGECLSAVYTSTTDKLDWRCIDGHEWPATFKKVKRGSWCPYCAANFRLCLSECHAFAARKGGECLSAEYINTAAKMEWKCSDGHTWPATFRSIRAGHWCPYCAGQIKHTIEDANILAELHGGKCESTIYKNNSTKLKWTCSNGHHFDMDYDHVRGGHWCRDCFAARSSLNHTKTLKDCSALAVSHGGLCISAEYTDCFAPLMWKCKDGHEFSLSYTSAQQDSWCPVCSGKESKPQRKIREILERVFPASVIHSNYRGFKWLRSEGSSKQEIDIFVEDLGIGIEYDGEQHFGPVECFGGEDGFNATLRRDRIKNDKIADHPSDVKYFVRFDYMEDITAEYVIARLQSAGINI